jgi:hypothetical protein
LIAAAILVFGSLAAYVAFNGLPVGGDDDGATARDRRQPRRAGGGRPCRRSVGGTRSRGGDRRRADADRARDHAARDHDARNHAHRTVR